MKLIVDPTKKKKTEHSRSYKTYGKKKKKIYRIKLVSLVPWPQPFLFW